MSVFRLGLTGSIGMGKSTTARFLSDQGCTIWDADAVVARLYAPGGGAVAPVAAAFPAAFREGAIDRGILKRLLGDDRQALDRLEAIVHPLVAADRAMALATAPPRIIVCDIPLLFEKGTESEMHATLLVTAPPEVQRARVLSRPGMTEDLFRHLLSRQMPDAEKRRRATHIVETLSLAAVEAYAQALVAHIKARHA